MKLSVPLITLGALASMIKSAPVSPPEKSINPIIVFAFSEEGAKNFGTDYSSPEAQAAVERFEAWKKTPDGVAEMERYAMLEKIAVSEWKDLPPLESSSKPKSSPVDTKEEQKSTEQWKPSILPTASNKTTSSDGYKVMGYYGAW